MLTDFDLRVVAYTPGGARLDVVPAITYKLSAPDGAGTLDFDVSEEVYGTIAALLEFAVEAWNGSTWVEVDDCRFLLNGDENNDRDVTGTHKISTVNAAARFMAANQLAAGESELVDGKRRFNSSTPGAIMETFFEEAKARGVADGLAWAPGWSIDFDADEDSDGVPWAEIISIGMEPGKISAWAALQSLLDQGMCEFRTSGRVMQLFNVSTGTDRTTGGAPVRLAGDATTMPVKRSTADLITHVTFYGDDGFVLEHENDGAVTGYGRLEAAIAQGGVSDEGTAIILANQTLTQGKEVRRQITATEPAAAAAFLPFVDYQRGDWVQGFTSGAWEKLRVAEIIVSRDAAGVVTVDAVLNDRFLSLLARVAKRQAGIAGGAVAGGSGVPSTGEDLRKPKAPTGVLVESTGYWSENVPLSQLAMSCTPVTQGENDVAIEVAGYEWWARVDDGADESDQQTASVEPAATWSPYSPGTTWLVKVRAISAASVVGAFSSEASVLMEYPIDEVGIPTIPIVRSWNGVVEVVWDGLIDTSPPTEPPSFFRQVNVYYSGEESGDYARIGTLFAASQRGSYVGLGVGSVVWFRFTGVDALGRESDLSDAISVTVLGIDGADIIADTITANQIVAGSITLDHLDAGLSDQITVSAEQVVIQAGRLDAVETQADGTETDLADLRLYVVVDGDELRLQRPESDKAFAMDDERIAARISGVDLSWWEAGQFNVPRLVATRADIAKHIFEVDPLGTGTVVRRL